MIKNSFKIFLFSILLLNGCMKVDTNAKTDFQNIQKDISESTNQTIYWDETINSSILSLSAKELSKEPLTEKLAVQIALLNNSHLQAVYENLGIAKAKYAQAGLLKNPIFSFFYKFSTKSKIPDLVDLDLIQNFLEILLIPLKKKVTLNELEATINGVKAEILNIIAETKIAFYTLAAEKQVWEMQKKSLFAAQLSYEMIQKLYAAGNVTELELELNRTLYEQMKLDVSSQEITVLESREKLNVLMGIFGKDIEWSYSSILPKMPQKEENFDNIENDVITKSLELQIARKNLIAAAAGFGIDTTKIIFPKFDIGVSAESEEGAWFVGPAFNLALPIFDIGKASSAYANAKIAQLWKEYTALAIDIRSMARSSRFVLLNAFRQSKYLNEVIVPLAEKVTYITFLQHNAMQIGIFDLLHTKQKEIEKKIQNIKMLKEYWIAKTKLELLLQGHANTQRIMNMQSPIINY